jgi:hypothetical protein
MAITKREPFQHIDEPDEISELMRATETELRLQNVIDVMDARRADAMTRHNLHN